MPAVVSVEPKTGATANRLAMAHVRRTLKWRRSLRNGDKHWRRAWGLKEGVHWKQPGTDDVTSPDDPNPRITVNKIGSAVDDYLPFLVARDPVFRLRPTQGADSPEAMRQMRDSVKALEGLLNYEWREGKMLTQLKRSALDFIVVGTGILQTGYAFDIDESATPDKDGTLNYDETVRVDQPFIKRVSPLMFLPDPQAPDQDLETSRIVGKIIVKPLGEVVANDRYNERVRREIKMGRITPTTLPSWLKREEMPTNPEVASAMGLPEIPETLYTAQTPVVLYELYDMRFGIYRLLLDTQDGDPAVLIEDPWPYNYLDGFPFALAKFIEINDQWYGIGLTRALWDQQDELNRNRTFRFLTRRLHAAQKIGVNTQALGDFDISNLDDPNQQAYIPLQGGENTFFKIPSPDIVQDSDKVEGDIDRDMQEIMGRDALLSGGQLPSRTSAAEIRARQGFIGAKIEGKVNNLDGLVYEAGRQLLQHIRANFTRPRVVRLLGAKGDAFGKVDHETIRIEADIQLETSSKQQFDPVLERSQAVEVLQTTLQALPMLQGQIDVKELYAWVFDKMDVHDADRFFLPARPQTPEEAAAQPENPGGGVQVGGQPPENPAAAELQGDSALGALSPEAALLGG